MATIVSKKKALELWKPFYKMVATGQDVDFDESEHAKEIRIELLLQDFEKFAKYYFPNVCKADFAKWQLDYAEHVSTHEVCHVALKISRDMAKSSVTFMLVMYEYYRGNIKSLGYFAHTQTQAEMLLSAIKIAFQKNEALKHDFGNRINYGSWATNRFVTTDGVSFRAIGAGQNPRGEKNEDADRFDWQIFDDFDDPEVCRSIDRLDNNWKYVLGDCFAAFHVSGRRKIIGLNNKIAEDCIIERMYTHFKGMKNAFLRTINLTKGTATSPGKSNWPQAYNDEQCKDMIDLVGDEADTEYFNDPKELGKSFQKEWIQYKKMPALSRYKILVAYLDGGFKIGKSADTKALLLIGFFEGEYHVRKCYVENASIEAMISWHYDLWNWLKEKNAAAIWYMEEVFLLSLLHDHFDAAVQKYGFRIPMIGDKRKKPNKDLRIQNMAGFFERGKVFFDDELREDRHQKRLIQQFLKFRPGSTSKEKDGPDAFEGAVHIVNQFAMQMQGVIKIGKNFKSKHKL